MRLFTFRKPISENASLRCFVVAEDLRKAITEITVSGWVKDDETSVLQRLGTLTDKDIGLTNDIIEVDELPLDKRRVVFTGVYGVFE